MTELVWEGKYDANRRRVAPLRVALPFQTVETVNESAQERQKALDLFSSGREGDWRNPQRHGCVEYPGAVDVNLESPFARGPGQDPQLLGRHDRAAR